MSYFDHPYISNSDIKAFLKSQGKGFEDPENLQLILTLARTFIVQYWSHTCNRRSCCQRMTLRLRIKCVTHFGRIHYSGIL